MTKRIKIFGDFNNTDEKGRVRLTRGSFSDLQKLGIDLVDGLEVILDDDELTTIGILEYSSEEKIWVAKVDWNNFQEKSE